MLNKNNPAHTPFHQENLKSLQGNLTAFSLLLRQVLSPKHIIEARGGLGQQTMRLMQRFPGVPIEVWERDPKCADELSRIKGITDLHLGEYPEKRPLGLGDLCVIDGHWTLKYFDTYQDFFNNGAGQYIFTDLARGKLHLHPQAYGVGALERADLWPAYVDEVARRLKPFKLTVVDHVKAPRSISYFLVRR